MLIRFFRSSFAAQYLVVTIIALVMWLPSLINASELQISNSGGGLLFEPLAKWLIRFPFVATLLALVLLLLQAFYFNGVLASNLLIARNGFSGALAYVLMFSFSPAITNFYQLLPAALFVMAALHMLFLIYDKREAVFFVFNAGFFVALVGLFYPPAFVLFFWLIIGLVIALQFDWRNLAAAFMGFLTPLYFLWSWYFLTDSLPEFYAAFEFAIGLPEFIFFRNFILTDWLALAILVLISFRAFVFVWTAESERNLGLRKKVSMTNLLLIACLFLFFWKPAQIHALVLIPLAVFWSYDLAYGYKLRFRTIWLYAMMFAMALNHYFQLLPDGFKSIF